MASKKKTKTTKAGGRGRGKKKTALRASRVGRTRRSYAFDARMMQDMEAARGIFNAASETETIRRALEHLVRCETLIMSADGYAHGERR